MTLLCIIIAVFLVTAIFSMAQMWTDSGIEDMRQKHGDWHIVLQNIPEKAGDRIRQRSDILYSSWYEDLNTTGDEGYSINGKNTALYGVEESYMADIWKYPVEGNYPRSEKEAAFSADAKELLGIRIGDQIVLQTPGGNLEYTVSGFYEDDSEFNDIMDGCCVYMNPSGFGSVTSINPGDVSPRFYIRFQKETGLRKTIGDLKQEYNLTDENVKENTAILAPLGASSSSCYHTGSRDLYDRKLYEQQCGPTDSIFRHAALYRGQQKADHPVCKTGGIELVQNSSSAGLSAGRGKLLDIMRDPAVLRKRGIYEYASFLGEYPGNSLGCRCGDHHCVPGRTFSCKTGGKGFSHGRSIRKYGKYPEDPPRC